MVIKKITNKAGATTLRLSPQRGQIEEINAGTSSKTSARHAHCKVWKQHTSCLVIKVAKQQRTPQQPFWEALSRENFRRLNNPALRKPKLSQNKHEHLSGNFSLFPVLNQLNILIGISWKQNINYMRLKDYFFYKYEEVTPKFKLQDIPS